MTIPMPEPSGWIMDGGVGGTLRYQRGPISQIQSLIHSNAPVWEERDMQKYVEAYATAKVREAQRWHPIDSAPHETLVVLGWYDENEVFKQEIALASAGRRYPGGASDMWWHGRATHWMPLPAPPIPGPVEP